MVKFFGADDGFDTSDDESVEQVDMDTIKPLDEEPPVQTDSPSENLEEISSSVLSPDEAPVDENKAPVDKAPVDETPVEEKPVVEDEAPVEEVTVDEAPVDEAPVDELEDEIQVDEAPDNGNSTFLEEKAQTNQAMYEMRTVAELVKALTDSKVIEAPAILMIGGLSAQYLKFEPKNDMFGFLQNLEDLERLEQFKTFTVETSWTHLNLPNVVSKQKINGTLEDRYDDLMKSKDDAEGVVKTWLTNKTVFDTDSQPSMVYQTTVASNTPCLDLKLTEHEPGSGYVVIMNAEKLGDAFNFMKCKALGSTDATKSVYLGNILKIIAKIVSQVTVVNAASVSKDNMDAVVGSPPENNDNEESLVDDEAEAPMEDEAVASAEDGAMAPAEGEADASAEGEVDASAEDEADAAAEDEADASAEGEAVASAEDEAVAPAEDEAVAPAEGEAVAPAEGQAVAPVEAVTPTGDAPDEVAPAADASETSASAEVAPFSAESIDGEPAKGGKRSKTRTKKPNLKMKVTRVNKKVKL